MLPNPSFIHFMIIRLNTVNPGNMLASIERSWSRFYPHRPMDYFFLDDFLDGMYVKETRLIHIFRVLSALVVMIACLGLAGLAAFTAERRTKEIGIRKVLGAKVFEILLMFYRDFIPLILIANIIACPMTYIIVRRWLQSYVYRVNIGIGAFIFAVIASSMIFLMTIGLPVMRAASANPVVSLRYE
jgi:putative ABC transport system permease protein